MIEPFVSIARVLAALAVAALISGCATSGADTKKADNPNPPEVIYKQADKLLGEGDYTKAAEKFEEVDRNHPYSPHARQAIVMSAFAYYKAGKYPEAVQAAQRYTTLHPGTKEAALAYHVIASSHFERMTDPTRDQERTKKALKALETLVRRFPESSYAAKARNRIKITKDMLAAAEMKVARYYLDQHNYLAAINRYRVVIEQYQTTRQVEEALMRVVEAYMALGIKSEAQTAAAVLGHNFPDSKWYQHAYTLLESDGLEPREDTGSWISRAVRKVTPG